MAYQSDTIATVVNRLNVRYFLPAIQREYVWNPTQILQLFDSLMRRYPISTFLFWELQPENRDKWEIYKFIDQYDERHPHNPPASTDGVQQLNLVLDGQQRLTSLSIGLKGTYVVRKKYRQWDNPNAWSKQQLYLNLLKDPDVVEDAETGLHYGFAFAEEIPKNQNGSYWFKVGRILDFDSPDRFEKYVDDQEELLPESATRIQVKLAERNLRRLHKMVWDEEVIAYYTEQDQEYDRVLDIFVRANDGGQKLSKSDLLLSMVTSKWTGINAREDIYGFVDRINNELTSKNNFDKDFILKTCLVVSDLPVTYKVSSFTNHNLDIIHREWERIKAAIESGVDLVNSFGINRETLTSANAVIPIIYYLFHTPSRRLRGTTPYDVTNASLIRKWLIMALLNSIFASLGDSVQRIARDVIKKQGLFPSDFPAEAINTALGEGGKSSEFDRYAMEKFLEITYQSRSSFLALSLLYDDNSWGTLRFHQDHIFPKSLFTTERLTEAGLSVEEQAHYKTLMNRVGNLELLLDTENLEKSNKDFGQWITTRDAGFRKRHLIPEDDNLFHLEYFVEFVTAREELIKKRIQSLLSLPA